MPRNCSTCASSRLAEVTKELACGAASIRDLPLDTISHRQASNAIEQTAFSQGEALKGGGRFSRLQVLS